MGLGKSEPCAHAIHRRKLAPVCAGANGPDMAAYTLHPPGNPLPAEGGAMDFETRELNVIGRWCSNSRTNERYGRGARRRYDALTQ